MLRLCLTVNPFFFLEEVTIDGDEARGRYKITGNEYFLEGHFKEQPVFPASIMIEALGQMCVFYLLQGNHEVCPKSRPSNDLFHCLRWNQVQTRLQAR